MTQLDRDTVALMKRRAYDIAATNPGVGVIWGAECGFFDVFFGIGFGHVIQM